MSNFTAISLLLLVSVASALVPPTAIEVTVGSMQQTPTFQNPSVAAIGDGIQKYASNANALESSTVSLSLKDRPPPPTAEEIAAKKRNFNVSWYGLC